MQTTLMTKMEMNAKILGKGYGKINTISRSKYLRNRKTQYFKQRNKSNKRSKNGICVSVCKRSLNKTSNLALDRYVKQGF